MVLGFTGSSLAQMGPQQVVVAPVQQRSLERTQPLVASVEPVTRSTIAAEWGGLVAERSFDEGQSVQKGATLVKTNVELLLAQRAAAVAAKDAAEAMLQRAQAEAENAAGELARFRKLQERGAVSEKEFHEALTADKVATAMIANRRAELTEKVAAMALLDLQIQKSETRCPLKGVVARRHVEVGQWIKQGEAVADVVQLDPLFVRIWVPEEVIATVREGDEAVVTFDALGRRAFTGKVAQILPEADPNSRTFAVKLLLDNPKMEIRPGFFGRAALVWKTAEASVVVPKDAVVTQGERSHVVAVRQGKAVLVPVERGLAQNGEIAVKGELKAGEQVVVRGNESLREGDMLMVQNAPVGPPGPPPPGGAATKPAAP
jgi:membrane fusion protein (multidrug efflux system)